MAAAKVGVRARTIDIGSIDWAAHWRQKVEVRQGQPVGVRDWDGRAPRFARMAAELDAATDPLIATVAAGVRKEDSLLDVGAGAGRYALPLAKLVARVTAAEPSDGMRAALQDALTARKIDNVSIVAGSWQDAVVEPHDVVLCAHVLYFIRDVVPFIEKLDAHARRACYIYLRVDARETALRPLWDDLVGGTYPSEPGFADLYPLLLSLGIRANVRFTPLEGGGQYADLDEALEQTRMSLGVTAEQGHDARIRQFLADHLVQRGDRWSFPPFMQTAIVWWEK